MGLCPSKAQQPHEDVSGTHGKAVSYGPPAAACDPKASNPPMISSSPQPGQRPASTDSGQPAAAAGDGTPGSPGTCQAAPGTATGTQEGVQLPSCDLAGLATLASSQQQVDPSPPSCNPAMADDPASTAAGGVPPAPTPNEVLVNGGAAAAAAAAAAGTAVAAGAAASAAVHGSSRGVSPQQQQLLPDAQQGPKQWDRAASVAAPSALANSGSNRIPSTTSRSVKFADPVPESEEGSTCGELSPPGPPSSSRSGARRGAPRRSASSSTLRSSSGGNEVSEAVLAKQAEILRSNKAGKLRMRRGGLDSSFAALQDALTQNAEPIDLVATRAAGLKHIGFGPFKRENQDEFFIQVGEFGGVPGGNLFCVFDGHGTHGKDAALYSRQLLPRLLDMELRKYFQRVGQDSEAALRGAVEVLITEVFGDTERNLAKSGVNLASSGTTASIAFQRGNRLWVAAAGDSRAILCTRNARDQWRALPLTIDHRPRRTSERERIEAAGARVAPKRLPSGRSVGEPRLWLQEAGGPGLLLSRSLGDLTAATVGCTSDPEVTFTTLRPHTDQVLVMATDGVWDVLTNEQVCDIVVESPDPHIACRRVLDAALYEWEERMSADNITVLVVEFEWNEEGLHTVVEAAVEAVSVPGFGPGPMQPVPHLPQEQPAAP